MIYNIDGCLKPVAVELCKLYARGLFKDEINF